MGPADAGSNTSSTHCEEQSSAPLSSMEGWCCWLVGAFEDGLSFGAHCRVPKAKRGFFLDTFAFAKHWVITMADRRVDIDDICMFY